LFLQSTGEPRLELGLRRITVASMNDESRLLTERRGPILVLTLNRPQVRNALDHAVSQAIAAALDELDADPGLRVAVLTGAGGNFSSGMDLKAFGAGELPVVEGRGLAGFAERPPRKPLIAAVEGYALAGGFEVALACDLIVASEEATFGLPEVKRGLLAAGGGLIRLPTRIPFNLATELSVTGAPLSAKRAAELGLVNRLTAPGAALDGALELAAEIAANGPVAVAAAKEVLGLVHRDGERAARERQRPINERIAASEDAREGARAFIEKREPVWQGR
jgi:enoyl-CoA hydratase